MNINYKQPQFELFPANSATLEDVNKPKFLLANLTLSIESLVILSILGIMVALFSFSLGVERGKHLSAQVLDERVAAAWNVEARRVSVNATKPLVMPAVAMMPQRVVTPSHSVFTRNFMQPHAVSVAQANSVVKTSVSAGSFTLQVATYKNEEYAQKEAMDLKAKGYQPFLMKKGDFWLVCVGKYASLENASTFLKKLPAKYRGGQIRRF